MTDFANDCPLRSNCRNSIGGPTFGVSTATIERGIFKCFDKIDEHVGTGCSSTFRLQFVEFARRQVPVAFLIDFLEIRRLGGIE
jgi:hypothetical protein